MVCGGMAILYVAAAFVFFMWWVRGSFIPAAFLAFCSGGFMLLMTVLFGTSMHDLTEGATPFIIAVFFLAFAPWYIRQQIERRRADALDRALNGVRFNGD